MLIENLEQRTLFAIPVSGGILQLSGYASSGSNAEELILNGTTIQLRNANTLAVIDSVSATGVTGANMNTGGGNDLFRVGRPDGTMMPNISITLSGGAGDDSLTGGKGNDSIFGDIGNDLMDGRAGADIIDGSTGFDTVDYSYRANAVKVTLGDNTANDGSSTGNNSSPAQYNDNGHDNVKNTEAVLGGSGNDSLIGSAASEWFDGGAGNDSIYAGDGTDTINGGTGADLAYGEGGDDYFFVQDNIGDKFDGGTGTTFASYDPTLDVKAPALGSSPAALTALMTSFVPVTTSAGLISPLVTEDSNPDFAPDDTFGDGGKTITFIGGTEVEINDLKIQQIFDEGHQLVDEKFLIVGTALGPNENNDFVLIRYNNDGTLDSTFGDDNTGIVFTDFSDEYNLVTDDDTSTDDVANSLVVDENGQIVVAGTATPSEEQSLIAVARYDANGHLDSTFGNGGLEILNAADSNASESASKIAVQDVFNGDTTEQDYVIAGTISPTTEGGNSDFLLTRIFDNGNQDFSFGDGEEGFTQTDYFHNNDFATGLAIDPETNNIWVSGYTQNTHGANFLVAGYDQDGSPIPGALTNYDFGADDFAYGSVISGSTLLVVGSTGFEDSTEGAILAVNISDSYPYPGGVVGSYYVFDSNGPVSLNAVTLDNDGNAVAAGSINSSDFYVYRFDPNTLATIGNPTTVDFATDDESTTDVAFGVAVESDGKLIVAGTSDNSAAITRLEPFHFVDVVIDPHTFVFTYTDDTGTHPIPAYLSQRITSFNADGTVELSGTPDNDVITVNETGDPVVNITINGSVYSYDSSQVTKVIIHGLAGNDSILADPLFPIPLVLDGGAGNDTLRGGAASNILLGGDGNDCIQGGAGRDLLIGGAGTDNLNGGADDDIFIGGTTKYDNNIPALTAIMQEWTRTDANYTARVNHITNGGGLNGSFKLNSSSVSGSSSEHDVLTGGAGTDLFFLSNLGNNPSDLDKKNETVIRV